MPSWTRSRRAMGEVCLSLRRLGWEFAFVSR
jgi:hypothetical protein